MLRYLLGITLLWSATAVASQPLTLDEAFRPYFRIGAAISAQQLRVRDHADLKLAARQFNSATPENLFKWQSVHPSPGLYDFELADQFVTWGTENQMFLVGHTLMWHSQTPEWVTKGIGGKPLDRGTALQRLRNHIDRVVGRYKGQIAAWDVVNEAINDEGHLRSSDPDNSAGQILRPWYSVIGDDCIEKAFEYAHAADPDAELYYNDYNEWHPKKIKAISTLVRRLQHKGIRIDGIGLQGHWGLEYPTLQEIDHMLTEYGKLGVKIMITELDVTVLPSASKATDADVNRRELGNARLDPFTEGLPEDMQRALANRYAALFRLFIKHSDTLDRVTFWGIHDGQSWRNDFPIRGRVDYPLLFDRNLQPKLAFESVLEVSRSHMTDN